MLEEIVEYLREKQKALESQVDDTSHIAEAIEALQKGHHEAAIKLLDEDFAHFEHLANEDPDILVGAEESLEDKRFWIGVGEFEVQRISRWLQFLTR